MRLVTVVFGALLLTLLQGCGSDMKLEDYSNREPKLVLEDYFQGETKAWGIFVDRSGDLRRDFVVDIKGTWDPESRTLVLEEDFLYGDGETDRRVWTLRKTGENSYVGTADDVIGEASGETSGNAFKWSYVLALKVKDKVWNVNFEDWMWLQEDGVLLNRAEVTKWGFKVGEATIFFRKPAESASAAMPARETAENEQRAAE